MRFTDLVQKALETAATLHDGQYRKGKKHLPVITHPMAVACIVSQYTDDEHILAAALLHDTLEDTSYTEAQLRADFGDEVAEIVLGVTAPDVPPKTPFEERWMHSMEGYIARLRAASEKSALVAAADKTHNFKDICEHYSSDVPRFLSDFGGTPEERIEEYGEVVSIIREKIAPSPLFDELSRMWQEYKTFVEHISETTNTTH